MTDEKPRKPRSFNLDAVEEHDTTAEPVPPPTPKPSKTKKPRAKPASASAKKTKRKPRAVRDKAVLRAIPEDAAHRNELVTTDGEGLADSLTPPPPSPQRTKGARWARIFLAALAGLVSLGIGLWVDQLIRDLFARQDWLGWLAVGLTALLVFAALAIVLREVWGIARMARIGHIRADGDKARIENDLAQARKVTRKLDDLYSSRPDTARGRAALAEHSAEIVDGRDLIHLAERDLLQPLDLAARAMVMGSAKRVSVVTAVSPRAIVDLGYVLVENTRLIRRLADHYGGRPGTLGFWRLARNVIAHLAVTGSIAVGDSLIQQVVGHGLAARISSRLGEGVVNGLLTARIGIAAIDVCRPLPFSDQTRPGVRDFLGELLTTSNADQTTAQK